MEIPWTDSPPAEPNNPENCSSVAGIQSKTADDADDCKIVCETLSPSKRVRSAIEKEIEAVMQKKKKAKDNDCEIVREKRPSKKARLAFEKEMEIVASMKIEVEEGSGECESNLVIKEVSGSVPDASLSASAIERSKACRRDRSKLPSDSTS